MRAAALWQAMAPKAKRARSASAPPPGARGAADAEQPGRAAEPGRAAADIAECELDGPLAPLPNGKGYDSEDDNDGPAHVVEDEELVGVGDQERVHDPDATQAARDSPVRRTATVTTGAKEAGKKLTAAQERFQDEQALWKTLKTDGRAPPLERPTFLPYKEGLEPEGFIAKPEHETGGPSPELSAVLKPDTEPFIYMAEIGGFDAQLFGQLWRNSNSYAAAMCAGSDDHYCTKSSTSRLAKVKWYSWLWLDAA